MFFSLPLADLVFVVARRLLEPHVHYFLVRFLEKSDDTAVAVSNDCQWQEVAQQQQEQHVAERLQVLGPRVERTSEHVGLGRGYNISNNMIWYLKLNRDI